MGVRPSVYVVLGATNVAEINKKAHEFYEKMCPKKFPDGDVCEDGYQGRGFDQVIYNMTNSKEFVVKGVVGYIESRSSEELAYALLTCLPDVFGKNDGYGFIEFPKRELRYNESILLERGDGIFGRDSYDDVVFCQRYGYLYEYLPAYMARYDFEYAKKILSLVGWNFGYESLKKLLVWNWT